MYLGRELSSLQQKKNEAGLIKPAPFTPTQDENESEDINLRAMMVVFYQDVGPRDIGNTISFLGLLGGHYFPQLVYHNMKKFAKKFDTELQVMTDKGVGNEIEATIKYELVGEYTAAEIQLYIKHFRQDKGSIPEN